MGHVDPNPSGQVELTTLGRCRLRELLRAWGDKPFRADQLLDWLWGKGVWEPGGMSNVPDRLVERFALPASRVEARAEAGDGTSKLLVELADGERVEAVMIPEARRSTVCLSTQVGCAMGCRFCATGAGGWVRDLSAGEILEQLLHLWRQTGRRPTNVVFMGMGEPLANYDATLQAVRAIVDPDRLGLSARKVTVSTVGLPRAIRRLAEEEIPVTLAISLHAPTDALRRELIGPSARPVDEVLAAARAYYASRHREVTLEYVLIEGVNDTEECVAALGEIARRLRCNVNVIRYNPVSASPYRRPERRSAEGFVERLRTRGVNAHLRRSRGLDADAACGQLRRRARDGAEDRRGSQTGSNDRSQEVR